MDARDSLTSPDMQNVLWHSTTKAALEINNCAGTRSQATKESLQKGMRQSLKAQRDDGANSVTAHPHPWIASLNQISLGFPYA